MKQTTEMMISRAINRFIFISLLSVYGALTITEAYANSSSNSTPMGDVLCTILSWLTGNLGIGLATLAMIVLGIGALLGKTSWGMAMTVGIGISVLFGANAIVSNLPNIDAPDCSTDGGGDSNNSTNG